MGIGDIDGNGYRDFIIGSREEESYGAIWITYMGPNMTIMNTTKILGNSGRVEFGNYFSYDENTNLLIVAARQSRSQAPLPKRP